MSILQVLQSDLFELLGFERFNMIQTLLQHRGEIVAIATDALIAMTGETMPPVPCAPGSTGNANGRKPAITSFVTIQSAEEKDMRESRLIS